MIGKTPERFWGQAPGQRQERAREPSWVYRTHSGWLPGSLQEDQWVLSLMKNREARPKNASPVVVRNVHLPCLAVAVRGKGISKGNRYHPSDKSKPGRGVVSGFFFKGRKTVLKKCVHVLILLSFLFSLSSCASSPPAKKEDVSPETKMKEIESSMKIQGHEREDSDGHPLVEEGHLPGL